MCFELNSNEFVCCAPVSWFHDLSLSSSFFCPFLQEAQEGMHPPNLKFSNNSHEIRVNFKEGIIFQSSYLMSFSLP